MLRKRPVPDRPCVLITSLVRPRGFPSAPWEHCLRCTMCLLWGADLRLWHSWQMSTVQDPRKTWLATGGLLTVWWKMLSLGPRLQQPSSSGSGFHKPPSLPPAGEGPICSQLALFWYSLNPLFCEHARVCVRAFVAKFFFFFSLAIPWFGLLAHVSSLGSSSGNSGPVLTLRSDDATPASLVGDLSLWATSPLAIAVRNVFCGGFFFFSWLCCPLRFQNSPQTRRRVSYCGNFSSFTTSSPGCWLLFLSFFFFFLFCPTSFCREWAAFLSGWCPLPALFCGSCSTSKWAFDEFVGEKVVSCPIPSPSWDRPAVFFMGQQICVCVVIYNKKTENWKH